MSEAVEAQVEVEAMVAPDAELLLSDANSDLNSSDLKMNNDSDNSRSRSRSITRSNKEEPRRRRMAMDAILQAAKKSNNNSNSNSSSSTYADSAAELDNDSSNNNNDCNSDNNNACLSVWKSLPEKYRVDKEFVLAVLEHWPTLPPKTEFERQFPQSLRFDRDVVLAFCNRSDFPDLYYSRHLYVPDCLMNDKEVMVAYCHKIPRSLQECSDELCDDVDVVQAAIALDGLELQYASLRLQEDKSVVMAACYRDGRALEFCPPGRVRQELTSDRDFMLSVLKQSGGSMLRLVAEPLRRDPELLLEALAHGMRFRYCPLEYQNDQAFLLQALSKKSELFLELPKAAQANVDLCLAAILSEDSTQAVHERALSHQPALKQNRQVLLVIAQRGSPEFLKDYFISAEEIFKDDKDIVLAVLSKQVKLFTYASARLRQDPDVLIAAMDEATAMDVLKTVPPAVQLAHPEIAIAAISVLNQRNLRYLRPHVQPDELWTNRHVALAWIRRGCRVLDSFANATPSLLADVEVAFEIAKHVWPDFGRVSLELRSDVAFMTKAVTANGRILRFAAPLLQTNMELLVRAVASRADALWPGCRVSKAELQAHLAAKLALHDTFVHDFLRGIAIDNATAVQRHLLAPSKRSQLPLLDRGVETSEAFKKLIAQYLGVPIGPELRAIRTAALNLERPPPPSSARPDMDHDDMDHPIHFHHLRAQLMEGGDFLDAFANLPNMGGGNNNAAVANANNNNDNNNAANPVNIMGERRMLRRRLLMRGRHRRLEVIMDAIDDHRHPADHHVIRINNNNNNQDQPQAAPAAQRALVILGGGGGVADDGPRPFHHRIRRALAPLGPRNVAEGVPVPVPPPPAAAPAVAADVVPLNNFAAVALNHDDDDDIDDDLDMEEDMLMFMMADAAHDDVDAWFDRMDR